jgi:hypothetical protein
VGTNNLSKLQALRLGSGWHIEVNEILESGRLCEDNLIPDLFRATENTLGQLIEISCELNSDGNYEYKLSLLEICNAEELEKHNSLPSYGRVKYFINTSRPKIIYELEQLFESFLIKGNRVIPSSEPEPQRQALRIPSGWHISSYTFFEVDPSEDLMEWFCSGPLFFAKNEFQQKAVELVYEPFGDPDGEYELVFYNAIKTNKTEESPSGFIYEEIGVINSRSRLDVVCRMEEYMNSGSSKSFVK